MIQLDMFDKIDDVRIAREDAASAKRMADNIRKGLWAKQNELAKMYVDINERLNIIERNICQSK